MNKREATCRRTECKAMVRLHRTSDHGWVISRFEMQHNHPCSATNGPNKQWPSHSDIDPMTMDVVRKLRENNRPIERVCTGQDDDTRTFPEGKHAASPSFSCQFAPRPYTRVRIDMALGIVNNFVLMHLVPFFWHIQRLSCIIFVETIFS